MANILPETEVESSMIRNIHRFTMVQYILWCVGGSAWRVYIVLPGFEFVMTKLVQRERFVL